MRCLQVSVRLILTLWLVLAPVKAWAGSMMLLGVGGTSGPTYLGPGDVVDATAKANALEYFSCSRVWSSAQANTSTNMCDYNAVTGGAAVCTSRGSSTGKPDTSAYCPSSLTLAAACAAAAGGSCVVSKRYNQIGGGFDLVQGTTASMPPAVLSSSPNGSLPAINCNTGSVNLAGNATIGTLAQPYTIYTLYTRVNGTSGIAVGAASGGVGIGGAPAAANRASVAFNTSSPVTSPAATDNAWHVLVGRANGASSVANLDGTDFATPSAGVVSLTGATFRECRPNAAQFAGSIAETAIFSSDIGSANSIAINNNARSVTNGYGSF